MNRSIRIGIVLSILLLVGGLYLSIGWFLGYAWAGVWNMGVLPNILCIGIGLFFGLVWLGFLFSNKNPIVYWISVVIAATVSAGLVWDQYAGQILPLRSGLPDILFAVVAFCLLTIRRPNHKATLQ